MSSLRSTLSKSSNLRAEFDAPAAWLAVRPRDPIHHFEAVREGECRMKVLSLGFQVAVVSKPRTLLP
jgi:hypothetical protein